MGITPGDSSGTATARCEEGGDDVKSARPLRPGLHTCYNGRYRRLLPGDGMPIPKTSLSSDWSLQPDSMKLDSLVIAHQPRRGEYVPGPPQITQKTAPFFCKRDFFLLPRHAVVAVENGNGRCNRGCNALKYQLWLFSSLSSFPQRRCAAVWGHRNIPSHGTLLCRGLSGNCRRYSARLCSAAA